MLSTKRPAQWMIFFGGLLGGTMPATARADQLSTQEVPLTNNNGYDTTPVGGHDNVSPWVVYAQTPTLSGSLSSVWYQRFTGNGVMGAPVPVSTGSTSDQLDDSDANHIVYTAYNSASTLAGSINAYDIATGIITTVATANSLFAAHVNGDNVIWLQGTSGAVSLMLQSISAPYRTPITIAGPSPTISSADVGERFVVWEAVVNGQRDVYAYDLTTGATLPVATNPNINERLPRTSGAWVVWQQQTTGATAVMAFDIDTQQTVTVAQDGNVNQSPTIDGNFIAYQSNDGGHFDVYVYRIPTGDTFQITHGTSDELQSNVFGNQVTYADNRTGQTNVYATLMNFYVPIDPNQRLDPNSTTTTGGGATDPNGTGANPNGIVGVDPNATSSNPNTGDGNSTAGVGDPNAGSVGTGGDANVGDGNTATSGGDPNAGNSNTVATGGDSNSSTSGGNPNAGNGNTVASGGDPNAGDGNTVASNPNDTGYKGGCGQHWCGKNAWSLPVLSVSWRPGATHVDLGFCKAVTIEIPQALPATDFLTRGERSAYLLFQEAKGGYTLCTYTHAAGRNGLKPYALTSCTNGARGGDVIDVNYIDLHWSMGAREREEPFSVIGIDVQSLMHTKVASAHGNHVPW